MAKVASLAINMTANTTQVTASMRKARAEIEAVNQAVDAGARSMKLFYQTQARAAGRTFDEQATRNAMAEQIKGMREQARQAKIQEEVQKRLFGGQHVQQQVQKAVEASPVAQIAEVTQHAEGGIEELMKSMGLMGKMGGVAGMEAVGGLAKISAGAGIAVAGLMMVEAAANRVRDTFRQLNSGEISEFQAKWQLAESIPILGMIPRASRALGEAYMEINYAEQNAEAAALRAQAAMEREFDQRKKQADGATDDFAAGLGQRTALAGKEGLDRELAQIGFEYQGMLKTIKKLEESDPFPNPTKYQELREAAEGWQNIAGAVARAKEQYDAAAEAMNRANPAEGILARLDEQLDTFGMTTAQLAVYEAQKAGVDEEAIRIIEDRVRAIEELKAASEKAAESQRKLDDEQKATAAEAQRVFEATRTPIEKYEAELAKLGELLAEGAIDWETYDRATKAARDKLPAGDGPGGRASAMLSGSAEAQRYAYDQTRGASTMGTAAVAKAQLKEQEKGNDYLAKITEGIQRVAATAGEPLDIT